MAKFNSKNGHLYTVKQLNEVFDQADGVVSGTGVSVVESVTAPQTATFTVEDLVVTMTDAGAAGSHGAQKVFTFPAGNIIVNGAVTDLTIARVGTALTATSAVVSSLGSVTVGTDNATLTSTEANIVPSTAGTLSSGAGTVEGQSTAVVKLDGTTTPAEVYLNFATPDAGSTGNDALTVNGTITLTYLNLGTH